MKKNFSLLVFGIIFSNSFSQTLNCSAICIQSIQNLDTVNHTVDVIVFNGDTNFVNYPSVVVTNSLGDTVANINNLFFFFGQMDSSTVTHTIPTTLTSLSTSFTGTVYFTDNGWNITCSYTYPMICTSGINELQMVSNPVLIYPNPTTENINISIPENEWNGATISIVDFTGKTVQFIKANSGNILFNRENMSDGIYLVITETPKGRYVNKLILK
jgi:hypothetical protein